MKRPATTAFRFVAIPDLPLCTVLHSFLPSPPTPPHPYHAMLCRLRRLTLDSNFATLLSGCLCLVVYVLRRP